MSVRTSLSLSPQVIIPREQEGNSAKTHHVLFLIDRFPERLGGAEGALLRTIRRLGSTRYCCSVATFAVDAQFGDIRHLFPCPFYVFPLRRTYDWNAMLVAAKLRSLIRSQGVSIVHTFFSTSDLWGGIIAKLSGCPVLISSRRDMGVERSAKHDLAYRLLGRIYDQVHAVSDEVRSFSIKKDSLRPERVVTVYNGVDLIEIETANGVARSDESLRLTTASHVIISVGNIRPVKGTDILVRTAALVCKEFPKAQFIIIGGNHDQSYFRLVQQLTVSLGLTSNVKFIGRRHDVPSVLKISDVFCQTSRSEGMPNALLEAMACRLPCVATDVGGTSEIIKDNHTGYLVPPENPSAAAARIISLLRDPNRARNLGEAAYKTIAERFTAGMMVNRLVKLYDELLTANGLL